MEIPIIISELQVKLGVNLSEIYVDDRYFIK